MVICTACKKPIDPQQGHVYVEARMQSGRLIGQYHKACNKRRRHN